MRAYLAGRDAAARGLPDTANPHTPAIGPEQQQCAIMWRRGWTQVAVPREIRDHLAAEPDPNEYT